MATTDSFVKQSAGRITKRTAIFALLLAFVLSACAPAVPPAANTAENLVGTSAALSGQNPTASPSGPAPWSLVAVGDSVPYNSPNDCPGCTGLVDRYAAAVTEATGHPVNVQNLSEHTGLGIDGLLEELKTDTRRREALANADIIVVSISYNDTAWSDKANDPCDGPTSQAKPDWSKFNPTCAAAAAEMFRPKFESIFAQIVALRGGKPTIFRTFNHYNDWVGTKYDDGSDVPPEATNATRDVLDPWNAMVCKAAQENGFTCADVYHAFNGPDGLTPSGDLLSPNYHPSDKGNEVIARVLADLGFAPLAP